MTNRAHLIGVELTGHCDLRCRHCLRSDLSTVTELDPRLFARVAREAKILGRHHFAFTGGEATLHAEFFRFFDILVDEGATAHFVTNGNSYPQMRERLLAYRGTLTGVAISLDGTTEAVHDRVRGKGSFRRTTMAIALAANDGWDVTVQMVVTRLNRHQLSDFAKLGEQLGAYLLMYAHAQPVERAVRNNLVLSPSEWMEVDAEVAAIRASAAVPVGQSSGHYDPAGLAHCNTLRDQSFNIDCHGRLTFCCQLSGVTGDASGSDVVADLRETSLVDALDRQLGLTSQISRERLRYLATAGDDPHRGFHCHFCLKRFGKLARPEPQAIGSGGRRLRVVGEE